MDEPATNVFDIDAVVSLGLQVIIHSLSMIGFFASRVNRVPPMSARLVPANPARRER